MKVEFYVISSISQNESKIYVICSIKQNKSNFCVFFQMLENNWKEIRDEGLAQLDQKTGAFIPEEENLRETGDWKQFTLYQRGK